MISLEEKKEIIAKFGKNEKDCGSSGVQIATLTKRINNLMEHFDKNKKDFNSKRGLLMLIGRRRSLLKYYGRIDQAGYQSLIADLGLRK